VLGVSTGDIFVCWGYLLVIYLCGEYITGRYPQHTNISAVEVIYVLVGASTGDIFVCWGYLLVIYLCGGGIYW
jgi:hypothetical protein